MAARIFLLSPAYAGGKRAQMTLNEAARFEVAVKLRAGSASVGEVFSFISGLYFRGKVAYSRAFAAPPPGVSGAFVIMADRGLVALERPISLEEMRQMADVPVDAGEPRFRKPLERDAARLRAAAAGAGCEFVLLGSVATPKYVEPLLEIFGENLIFPVDFIGRGDLSRGGLMLRSAREAAELRYIPVKDAARRGKRPPRLPNLTR